MSAYLVLARKYRPKTFDEVIGQESVTRVLIGAIEEERIGHAYLFAGPRGTGKTTIARILARALNCEKGPTSTPCGTCERCLAADEGSEVDVIELDAASHTGVDTIRELRDEVAYAPMRARRKVYIVDEVHMLSKAAFNALLKTLEEPPPHVVFLFATTEPHKVLDTILSRCQVMRLSSLSEERIGARLTDVFRLEGVSPGEGVVEELARMARGGMRDALSLADKLLALSGTTPTLEDLLRLGGETGGRQIEALLASIEAGDPATCLTQLAEVQGEEEQLVIGLLESLRTSLVLLHCGAQAPFVSVGEAERAAAIERGERLGAERLELMLADLLRARERMRLVPDQAILVLESTLLDLCREEVTLPLAELVARLGDLERRLESGAVAPPSVRQASPSPEPRPESKPKPQSAPAPPATPPSATRIEEVPRPPTAAPSKAKKRAPSGDLSSHWGPFLADLRSTHGALADLLDSVGPKALQDLDGERVRIRLGPLDERQGRLAKDRRNQAACSRTLSQVVGRSLTVELEISSEPASSGSAASSSKQETSAGPSEASAKTPKTKAGGRSAASTEDPLTERVSDLFGGVIEDLS